MRSCSEKCVDWKKVKARDYIYSYFNTKSVGFKKVHWAVPNTVCTDQGNKHSHIQETTRVLDALCQELGPKTKHIFLISQHHTREPFPVILCTFTHVIFKIFPFPCNDVQTHLANNGIFFQNSIQTTWFLSFKESKKITILITDRESWQLALPSICLF